MTSTNIIKFAVLFIVTLLIFYLIFQKIDYVSLKKTFLNANLSYLVIASLVVLLVPILSAKKWQLMLRAMNYSISWKESFDIIMAVFPVSAITPSKSGHLIKAYYLRNKIPVTQTVGAIIIERFIDVLMLSFFSFIGALILKNESVLYISCLLYTSPSPRDRS